MISTNDGGLSGLQDDFVIENVIMQKLRKDPRLFLHTCCGPCACFPVFICKEQGIQSTLFFYNPNIHPQKEWTRRFENARIFADKERLPFIFDEDYKEADWRERAWEKSSLSRCGMCYTIRMEKTAKMAVENGFSYFSTSLLVSPYQDFDGIVKAGKAAADKEGITFLPIDFRPGFRKGQEIARDTALYRQKFCGCIVSLEESRFREKVYRELEI